MSMSRRVLAQHEQRDTGLTTTYTLYADGHVAVETNTIWQGDRDTRAVTDAGYLPVNDIDPADPDSDAEALLVSNLDRIEFDFTAREYTRSPAFRVTRLGAVMG